MGWKTLADYFAEIEDPRRTGFAHRHDLVEMLVITTCALFSEVEGFEDIARWARVKESWLRRFLPFTQGQRPSQHRPDPQDHPQYAQTGHKVAQNQPQRASQDGRLGDHTQAGSVRHCPSRSHRTLPEGRIDILGESPFGGPPLG